jgi:glutathione synthase/RimK-type ligase-like ATP-grasp enzyme
MDIGKIVMCFEKLGIQTEVTSFDKLDLRSSYQDTVVLYTSSEDLELKYKSYIEDIILFLERRGAILLPDFAFFRAHHNKSFMELLRYELFPEQSENLNTRIFGTLEEFIRADLPDKKFVVKSAYGAGSRYVKLAKDKAGLANIAAKMSRCIQPMGLIKEIRRRIIWRGYHKASLNRNKFIVQNFIEGLRGDFKVLKYGRRFYTLYRKNRKNDFRASGGGRLEFRLPENVSEEGLLDFAKEISDKIGTPLCSLDIAWDGKKFILIEFQCINFGPYAAEKSTHCHIYENGKWTESKEVCCLEQVFCEAIAEYVELGV